MTTQSDNEMAKIVRFVKRAGLLLAVIILSVIGGVYLYQKQREPMSRETTQPMRVVCPRTSTQVEIPSQEFVRPVQIPLDCDFKLSFETASDRNYIDIKLFPRKAGRDENQNVPDEILKKAKTYTEDDFWEPLRAISFRQAQPVKQTKTITVHFVPYGTMPRVKN